MSTNPQTALAATAPPSNGNGQESLIASMAAQYGINPGAFKATIVKTVFPQNVVVSNEQFAAFLMVAHTYQLNPFVKEIYAFPGKGGGIVPIVSLDGWVTLINRQPKLDGVEFEEKFDGEGRLVAVTTTIYRKDRSHPTKVTEYLSECKRSTDTWTKYEFRMLRHKSLIQCARVAFGLAGIYDPDEAERIAEAEGTGPQVNDTRTKSERLAAKLSQDTGIDVTATPVESDEPERPEENAPFDEKQEKLRLRGILQDYFTEKELTEKQQTKFLKGEALELMSLDALVEATERID